MLDVNNDVLIKQHTFICVTHQSRSK